MVALGSDVVVEMAVQIQEKDNSNIDLTVTSYKYYKSIQKLVQKYVLPSTLFPNLCTLYVRYRSYNSKFQKTERFKT